MSGAKPKTKMTKKKTNEKAKKAEKENSISIVAGFQQIVQDLLVPELKAIQVTLQHHGELIQGLQQQTDERFTTMQRQTDKQFTAMQQQMAKEFTKVWQVITELLEAQRHTQLAL